MKRLMPQAQRILRNRLIEFIARGAALALEERLIASEGAQPVAGGSASRADAQVGEQVRDVAASPDRESADGGSGFEKMQVRIDEAGRERSSCELDQMRARADQRLQLGIWAVAADPAAADRDRVAIAMTENHALMQDEIGLCGCSCPRAPAGS